MIDEPLKLSHFAAVAILTASLILSAWMSYQIVWGQLSSHPATNVGLV